MFQLPIHIKPFSSTISESKGGKSPRPRPEWRCQAIKNRRKKKTVFSLFLKLSTLFLCVSESVNQIKRTFDDQNNTRK